MTAPIPALLQPMRDRLAAATEGPWDRHDAQIRHTQIDGWVDPEGRRAAQEQTDRDIQFVMNAPTDQAKLIAAIEAVVGLHFKTTIYNYGYCPSCEDQEWPCKTYAALTQALEGVSK